MHKDFHLYGTYMAAKDAGYEESDAKKIAFAAQMVDEFGKELIKENVTVTPMIKEVIKSLFSDNKIKEIADIWVPFHFIPKNTHRSEKSIFEKYQCGYDENCVIKDVINKMYGTNASLEQVGIAMHVLADSFAHQEFCGVPCRDYKKIKEVKCQLLSGFIGLENAEYVPNFLPYQAYFGHGCIGHLPDLSWVNYEYKWTSGESEIRNNPEIFADAYEKMFKELARFKNCNTSKDDKTNKKWEIKSYLINKSFEMQKDCYNAIMKNRAIIAAKEFYNQEISASGSDLKGKNLVIQNKLKEKSYAYEQIVLDTNNKYQIKEISKSGFNLYNLKPEKVGTFDEESDTSFREKCDGSDTLSTEYEEYKKKIQNENSEEYKKFKDAAKKHIDLVKSIIGEIQIK